MQQLCPFSYSFLVLSRGFCTQLYLSPHKHWIWPRDTLYCVEGWSAQWLEPLRLSNIICFTGLQIVLTFLTPDRWTTAIFILKFCLLSFCFFGGNHHSVAQLLCFSLWGKRDSHCPENTKCNALTGCGWLPRNSFFPLARFKGLDWEPCGKCHLLHYVLSASLTL